MAIIEIESPAQDSTVGISFTASGDFNWDRSKVQDLRNCGGPSKVGCVLKDKDGNVLSVAETTIASSGSGTWSMTMNVVFPIGVTPPCENSTLTATLFCNEMPVPGQGDSVGGLTVTNMIGGMLAITPSPGGRGKLFNVIVILAKDPPPRLVAHIRRRYTPINKPHQKPDDWMPGQFVSLSHYPNNPRLLTQENVPIPAVDLKKHRTLIRVEIRDMDTGAMVAILDGPSPDHFA